MHVERQVQTGFRRFDKADNLRDQPLEFRVAADQFGIRESILQLARQCIGIVTQQNRADALIALCDEDRSQRALAHREADPAVRAASTVVGRRHSQNLGGFFIEACIGVVASGIDCIGHGSGIDQLVAQTLDAMGTGILFRRESGDCLEHAMKMERADARVCRERIETGYLLGILDQPARRRHARRMLLGECGLIRLAAFAGTESRLFGFCARRIKVRTFSGRGARAAHEGTGSTRRLSSPRTRSCRRPRESRATTAAQRGSFSVAAARCVFLLVAFMGAAPHIDTIDATPM